MSYHDHTSALGREVAWLTTSRATYDLDVDGVRVAAASRGQVLALMRRVLADVAPDPGGHSGAAHLGSSRHSARSVAASRVPPLLSLAEAAPLAALSRTLEAHPDLPLAATGAAQRAAVAAASPGGRTWVEIGVRAMHADHHWRTATTPLSIDQRWSAVADVAALAQSISILDAHLGDRVAQLFPVDPALAEGLRAARHSGLRVAGAMAQAVATTGQLPPYATTESTPARTAVLTPTTPGDLVRAQTRLAAQVRAASQLAPDAVVIIARSQATLARTAEVLLREGDPARSRFASALAWGLEDAASGRTRLASAVASDQAPITQAAAITRYLVEHRPRWRIEPESVRAPLTAALEASPAVVEAIATHAARAVATGAWLTTGHETDHESAYPWRALGSSEQRPRLVAGLQDVSTRATIALVRATTRPEQIVGKPPREVLAAVNTLTSTTRPHIPTTAPPPARPPGALSATGPRAASSDSHPGHELDAAVPTSPQRGHHHLLARHAGCAQRLQVPAPGVGEQHPVGHGHAPVVRGVRRPPRLHQAHHLVDAPALAHRPARRLRTRRHAAAVARHADRRRGGGRASVSALPGRGVQAGRPGGHRGQTPGSSQFPPDQCPPARRSARAPAWMVARVNGARLRVLRQYLGLDVDGFAQVFHIAPRTIRRWETDRSAPSPGVVAELTALLNRSEALVAGYLAELAQAAEPVMVTYVDDEELWATQPELRPLPAAWHRSLAGRVLAQRPEVEVAYPT